MIIVGLKLRNFGIVAPHLDKFEVVATLVEGVIYVHF